MLGNGMKLSVCKGICVFNTIDTFVKCLKRYLKDI